MSATSLTLYPPRLSALYPLSRSFFRTAATVRPSRSAINAIEALLSMDHRRWFTSVSDQGRAFGRHNSKTAARFLIEYRDHVGCCCRIALFAARRPPCAQADFKISSNSGVQRQVFPLGLPNFCPFMGPPWFVAEILLLFSPGNMSSTGDDEPAAHLSVA